MNHHCTPETDETKLVRVRKCWVRASFILAVAAWLEIALLLALAVCKPRANLSVVSLAIAAVVWPVFYGVWCFCPYLWLKADIVDDDRGDHVLRSLAAVVAHLMLIAFPLVANVILIPWLLLVLVGAA